MTPDAKVPWWGLLLLLPWTVLLNGWALSTLWGWFVVPLGPPPVGVFHACGLSVMAFYAQVHLVARMRDPMDSASVQVVAAAVVTPLAALGVGWAYHALIGVL